MKAAGFLVLGACTTFEDPTLVVDLRVLAMTASPPEQVIDIDLASPQLNDVVDQLQPTFVCAIVADPQHSGNLHWSMRACLLDDDSRCDETRPNIDLGFGEALDPEVDGKPFCAPVAPSSSLVGLLVDAFDVDPIGALSGLSYAVELRVGASDGSRDDDVFGVKELRVFPRIPETRVANRNPTLAEIQLISPELHIPVIAPCTAGRPRLTTQPGQRLDILPVESAETRENYPVLAIDGSFQSFDETIRYQFLTTAGSLSDEFSGGPPDFAGNLPRLGSTWTAPKTDRSLEAQLWVMQRDERGGGSVYPICVHVEPIE